MTYIIYHFVALSFLCFKWEKSILKGLSILLQAYMYSDVLELFCDLINPLRTCFSVDSSTSILGKVSTAIYWQLTAG